jgi:hypothetical protein
VKARADVGEDDSEGAGECIAHLHALKYQLGLPIREKILWRVTVRRATVLDPFLEKFRIYFVFYISS